MTEPIAGQLLGRYELLLPVAKGGMAQVWAARLRGSRGFQKTVAIKTILAGAMDDARMEQMFLDEATLAAQIHHPNVVGTLELGEDEGILYLVMEWVEGESLQFVMSRARDRGGIPLPVAVNLIGQACKGLHAAHDLRDESGNLLGLVHRDISAQNVLVTYAGTAKLVDFGIAKATARSSSVTEAGEVKGKFAYMAPEQIMTQPIDRRTDVFAMGTLLYLLTTGTHPFKGDSPGETLRNICLSAPPRQPTELVESYPVALQEVVMKALRKAPDERWSSANEMLAALEQATPAYLEGSYEMEVAKYMAELLGQRAADRRTQLRLAQELADRLRPESSFQSGSGSFSSLRGMAVDQAAALERAALIEAHARSSEPSIEFNEPPPKRGRRALAVGVGSTVALLGAAAFYIAGRGHRALDGSHGAAASPVTAAAPAHADVAPVVAPAPAPPPPALAASAAPAPASSSSREVHEDPRDALKRARAKALVATPRPATGGQPAATAPAVAPPPINHPRAEEPVAPAGNAWDPGTFGGRR
jgi:serine/threonine protein kinase